MREQHAGGQHRGLRAGARARWVCCHALRSLSLQGALSPGRRVSGAPRPVAKAPNGAPLSLAEKLKFTPPPQPLQCMEFNKEVTVSCSATGREKPTIQWTKTGEGGLAGAHLSPTWTPGAPTEWQTLATGAGTSGGHLVQAPAQAGPPRAGKPPRGTAQHVWPPHPCPCRPADGSSLPSHVSHNAGILSFHKVSRSDSGNYTCIASNSPQGEIRATVQLVVAGEGSPASLPALLSHLGGMSPPGWHVPAGTNVSPDPELFPMVLKHLFCQCLGYSPRGCATLLVLAPLSYAGSVSLPGADSLRVILSTCSFCHVQAGARAHDGVPGAHGHVPVPGRGGPRAAHPVEREGQDFGSQQAAAQVRGLHSELERGSLCAPGTNSMVSGCQSGGYVVSCPHVQGLSWPQLSCS